MAYSLGAQYFNIASLLAEKTRKSRENTDKVGPIEFQADVSRAYLPGDPVTAHISIPTALLDKYSSLVCQLKCEVHTYYIQSNGQTTTTIHRHEDVFDFFSVLQGTRLQPHEIWPESMSVQPQLVTPPDDLTTVWQVNFRLPQNIVRVMAGKDIVTTTLPSMFIDRPKYEINGHSNSSIYCLKLKGVNKGLFSSDLKAYVPLLVLPFSSTAGHTPPLPPPQDPQRSLSFSQEYTTHNTLQTVSKALFLDKGLIKLKISFPHLREVPLNASVPFFLEIEAYGASPEDLEPGGASRLPSLPLTGAGEDHPRFTLERKSVGIGSKHIGKWSSAGAKNSHKDTIPCSIEWCPSHLGASNPIPFNERTAPFAPYGNDWTPAVPNEEATKKSDRFVRKARVIGLVKADVCPTVDYTKLKVNYKLVFRWPIQGASNDVDKELGEWNAATGITEKMAASVDRVELARSILTTRPADSFAAASSSSSSAAPVVAPPPYPHSHSPSHSVDKKGEKSGW